MPTQPPTPAAYLTAREIADLLACGQDKVMAWIHSGELVAVDISETRNKRPRWRIARESLDDFLLLRQSQPPKPAKPKRKRTRAQLMAGVTRHFRGGK